MMSGGYFMGKNVKEIEDDKALQQGILKILASSRGSHKETHFPNTCYMGVSDIRKLLAKPMVHAHLLDRSQHKNNDKVENPYFCTDKDRIHDCIDKLEAKKLLKLRIKGERNLYYLTQKAALSIGDQVLADAFDKENVTYAEIMNKAPAAATEPVIPAAPDMSKVMMSVQDVKLLAIEIYGKKKAKNLIDALQEKAGRQMGGS